MIGYTKDGILWNYFRDIKAEFSFIQINDGEPVPEPVPWYERPEADGALVKYDDGLRFIWNKYASPPITVGCTPLTPGEVRELLAKAEALAEHTQPRR